MILLRIMPDVTQYFFKKLNMVPPAGLEPAIKRSKRFVLSNYTTGARLI